MTERSFQECRIIMRKINQKRSQIANAEGNVGKWTKIQAVHEANGSINQAEGTKKLVFRAMEQLKKRKEEFAAMKFPDSDLPDLPNANYDELEEFKMLHDDKRRIKSNRNE